MLNLPLILSVMLNVGLLLLILRSARSVRGRCQHTWTPWSEWSAMRSTFDRDEVFFRHVRYCTQCVTEDAQEIGRHTCTTRGRFGDRECAHMGHFTSLFDPMYEIKRLEREIDALGEEG